MYGRVYTCVVSGVASPAAAFDLYELVAATLKPLALLRLLIAQTSEPTTEEEQLIVQFLRGYTTSGSGGSAPTPQPLYSSDSTAAFTLETMNTTVATAGTPLTIVDTAFNTRSGLDLPFAPEEQPIVLGAERLVIRVGAPTDAITFRSTLWVRELA